MEQATDTQVRPLYRREYDELIRLGYFQGEPIELIEGQLLVMSPIGNPHRMLVNRLNRLLVESIPAAEGEVTPQGPIAASEISEPEPDLYVSPPQGPEPDDIPGHASLVIEVAVSSQRRDLGVKARLYGAMGVPDYWVIDARERRVVVHRGPRGDGYAEVVERRTGRVAALHHPAVALDVAALFDGVPAPG